MLRSATRTGVDKFQVEEQRREGFDSKSFDLELPSACSGVVVNVVEDLFQRHMRRTPERISVAIQTCDPLRGARHERSINLNRKTYRGGSCC